jgi:two-component system response regulator DctR
LKNSFTVVLIEDDPMVQEVNRQFIERVAGFHVAAVAGNGNDGIRCVQKVKPDLVFLDIFMPGQDGVAVLKQLRSLELPVDVIAVTAANDASTIQNLMRLGLFDYIIKPFKFERVQETLERFRTLHSTLHTEKSVSQGELDQMFRGAGPSGDISENVPVITGADRASPNGKDPADLAILREELPKGLNSVTMKQILLYMASRNQLLSAEEVADGVGIARVTARRYLDYLEKSGCVQLDVRYGGVGRPINRYGLVREQKKQN